MARGVGIIVAAFCLAACSTSFEQPRNLQDMAYAGYQAERQPMGDREEQTNRVTASYQNAGRCADTGLALHVSSGGFHTYAKDLGPPQLSPGDMVRITLPSDTDFSGDYIVSADGYLRLPLLEDIPAAGFSAETLEHSISRLLVGAGYFQPQFSSVDVSVLQWAPIQVHISGAVFSSGDVILNEREAKDDTTTRLEAGGDYTTRRSLTAAIFAAAGARPDADLRNVILIRGDKRQLFDLTGALNGARFHDPMLIAGDRIHIPSRQCFQLALARPSRITPPGVRIYMSNLTVPARSNANSAIGQHATSLPYGTRLLQGVVSANCVGGTQATNANRWAVLISRNPITGKSEVIARSIEDLLRRADRDDFNPVLLPNDAIACYDSHVTNLRDVIATVTEAVSPALNTAILAGVGR